MCSNDGWNIRGAEATKRRDYEIDVLTRWTMSDLVFQCTWLEDLEGLSMRWRGDRGRAELVAATRRGLLPTG